MPTVLDNNQPIPTIYATYTGREMLAALVSQLSENQNRYYDQREEKQPAVSHVYIFQLGFQGAHKLPETHHPEMVEKTMENKYPGAIRVPWQNFTDEIHNLQTGNVCQQQPAKKTEKKAAKKAKAA